jgi:hypothetical protein
MPHTPHHIICGKKHEPEAGCSELMNLKERIWADLCFRIKNQLARFGRNGHAKE